MLFPQSSVFRYFVSASLKNLCFFSIEYKLYLPFYMYSSLGSFPAPCTSHFHHSAKDLHSLLNPVYPTLSFIFTFVETWHPKYLNFPPFPVSPYSTSLPGFRVRFLYPSIRHKYLHLLTTSLPQTISQTQIL